MRREQAACRYAPLAGLGPLDAAREAAWLTSAERAEGERYRDPGRRAAWLAGRIVAKELLQSLLPGAPPAAELEILSRNAAGQAVRPTVVMAGRRFSGSLSITHTGRGALAAACVEPGLEVGVDLVEAGTMGAGGLGRGFLEVWFGERERRRLCGLEGHWAARFWAAKEAVYKACNSGESFAPQRIEIDSEGPDRLTCADGQGTLAGTCDVWAWECDGQAAVLALADRDRLQQRRASGALRPATRSGER